MRCLTSLIALIATTQADKVSTLVARREECDAYEHCSAETYVQLLVDLGDTWISRKEESTVEDFLSMEMVDKAIEAYEVGAERSFDDLGPESDLHLMALLRLADAFHSKGEYKDAYERYAQYTNSQVDGESTGERARLLAKQGEAAALGGQSNLAATTLDATLRLYEQLSAERRELMSVDDGVDDGVSATRHAWVHMLQAGMLRSSDPFSALAHVAQALELLQTDMTRNATTSEKMNYAASNAASNAASDGAAEGATEASSNAGLQIMGDASEWWMSNATSLVMSASICSCLKLSLLMEMEQEGQLAELGMDKKQLHEHLLLTYDVQAQAGRQVGHASEEGLAEALYTAFVAQLGREGRTDRAAKHTANFFGRSAYEMAYQDKGQADKAKEEL